MISPPSQFGLFETVLSVRGKCLLAEEHAERLSSASACLGLPAASAEQILESFREAAARIAQLDEGVARCSWFTESDDLADESCWKLRASSGRLPAGVMARRESGRVIVLDRSFVRSMPHFKTIGEPSRGLAMNYVSRRDAEEGLYVDRDGFILEGISTNVFAVDGATLKTPPLSAGLLPGIMRGWVLANAAAAGYEVEETAIRKEDLLSGSFLTSSLTPIAAIRQIDGESTQTLDGSFEKLVQLFETVVRSGKMASPTGFEPVSPP